VFNPLTVFFCHNRNGSLGAIIYEVHNTFRERHCYVLPVNESENTIIEQNCKKEFYVSPFVPDACDYKFKVHLPEKTVKIEIQGEDKDGVLLLAYFTGTKVFLSDKTLLKTVFSYPLMTLKVIAGIHYEALKLLIKRVPFFIHKPYENNSKPCKNSIIPLRRHNPKGKNNAN